MMQDRPQVRGYVCPQCGATSTFTHQGVHINPSYKVGFVVVAVPGKVGIQVPADDKDAIWKARRHFESQDSRRKANCDSTERWTRRAQRRNTAAARAKLSKRMLRMELAEAM
jgi:hypothetical protein